MQNNNGKSGTQGQGGLSWVTPSGAAKNSTSATPRLQAPQNSSFTPSKNNMPQPRGGGGFKTVAVFAIGALIGVLIGWSVFSPDAKQEVAIDTHDAAEETTLTAAATGQAARGSSALAVDSAQLAAVSAGNVTVAANQPAGMSVAVSGLSVSTPTWVVVFEGRDGKPGNILGAGLVFAGQTNAAVPLLRTTETGKTYFVASKQDDGDKAFSIEKDAPTGGFVEFAVK